MSRSVTPPTLLERLATPPKPVGQTTVQYGGRPINVCNAKKEVQLEKWLALCSPVPQPIVRCLARPLFCCEDPEEQKDAKLNEQEQILNLMVSWAVPSWVLVS